MSAENRARRRSRQLSFDDDESEFENDYSCRRNNMFNKHIARWFTLLLGVVLAGCLPGTRALAQEGFPLKDGDTWVMVGDSITAQHLHSNYFEAFCYARFPKWTFRFRNSGVGGDTIPRALARFDWDVAAWKPTVVSVELGMNDSGAGPDSAPGYIANMEKLTERIRAAGARPVVLTSSAVNDGTTSDKLGGRNLTLDRYATALKDFAAKQNAPFANQFHGLLDTWGKNKVIEDTYRLGDAIRGW
jgi:lysophospholipase L1-like esterase